MAFLDQAKPPLDQRSMAIVGGIHVIIGTALVFGLAGPLATIIKDPILVARDIPTHPIEPPPPPERAKENTNNPIAPTPIPAPVPDLPLIIESPISVEDVVLPKFDDIALVPNPVTNPGTSAQPIPQPKPKPMFTASGPIAKNNPGTWASTQDYPRADLREGNEGVTRFILSVGTNGRVSACRITATSGFASLDKATCNLVSRRARFNAAKDTSGSKVSGSYSSSIRWVIPD